MAVPEGLHQFKQINSLRWLTRKNRPNTFQELISRLANRNGAQRMTASDPKRTLLLFPNNAF